MYGGSPGGGQMSTLLFGVAIGLIVALVWAFIYGLSWVMTQT